MSKLLGRRLASILCVSMLGVGMIGVQPAHALAGGITLEFSINVTLNPFPCNGVPCALPAAAGTFTGGGADVAQPGIVYGPFVGNAFNLTGGTYHEPDCYSGTASGTFAAVGLGGGNFSYTRVGATAVLIVSITPANGKKYTGAGLAAFVANGGNFAADCAPITGTQGAMNAMVTGAVVVANP